MVFERTPDWENRFANYEKWCKTVRDPARETSEGVRWLRSQDGKSSISYEIAPLPSGRFAIRFRMEFDSTSGMAIPWSEYESRQACLDELIDVAKRCFDVSSSKNLTEAQDRSRRQIYEKLQGGLFGFIEPDIESCNL